MGASENASVGEGQQLVKPRWHKDHDPPIRPPQRRKGTGSVSQRKDGRWVASIARWDGKGRRYAYEPTKATAVAALERIRRRDASAEAVTKVAGELMAEWGATGTDERKRRQLADRFVDHLAEMDPALRADFSMRGTTTRQVTML